MKQVFFSILLFLLSAEFCFGEVLFREVDIRCKTVSNNTCPGSEKLKKIFKSYKESKKQQLSELAEKLKDFDLYRKIDFEIKNGVLIVEAVPHKSIREVSRRFVSKEEIDMPTSLPLKEGGLSLQKYKDETREILVNLGKSKGFESVKVNFKVSKVNETLEDILIEVDLAEPVLLSNIIVNTKSQFIQEHVRKALSFFIGTRFDEQLFKEEVNGLKSSLFEFGYYTLDLSVKTKKEDREVVVVVDVINSILIGTDILGETKLDKLKMKKEVADAFSILKREISEDTVKKVIEGMYHESGYFYNEVGVKKFNSKNHYGDQQVIFKVMIKERNKTKVLKKSFSGNLFFSDQFIQDLFYDNGTDVSQNNGFDKKYYESFPSILENLYHQSGFVTAKVDGPVLKGEGTEVSILYKIIEGKRALIKDLRFKGVPAKLESEIKKRLTNKQNGFFNPLAFETDLLVVLRSLSDKGYYFAKYDRKPETFIRYNSTVSNLNIEIPVNLGPRIKLKNIFFWGNYKTRRKFLVREMDLPKGSYISREQIVESKKNLLSLGLFQSVHLELLNISDKGEADLLAIVKEKDFGVIEIAPGIRSDLGLKFSSSITYKNIDGLGKKIAFKGTVNKRLNLNSLDDRRREESKSLIEYDTNVTYSEKYLFDSSIDLNASLTKLRRRYFSFDADIQKISTTFSTSPKKWLKFATVYQLESISQFDATEDREHGQFQIGSMTPSVTLDFRDNRIQPTKGFYTSLACEFANPALFSQETDDLTIDYYKLVNRSRFYYPLGQKGVLAVSLTAGIQENLARDKKDDGSFVGYIPNIKVFRLSGIDSVRGFEDDEINRLLSGNDISQVEVNKRAYMANIKIEPRFYLSDTTMLGVFYDAGRIFINEFEEDSLRSSVGLSFKYLTPVGSLDFDYGIKLLRNRDSDDKLETPGRLHVSIGFF